MESSYCLKCIHYFTVGMCEAFPDGIPEEIFTGEQEHTTPTPEQDNEIVFELNKNFKT